MTAALKTETRRFGMHPKLLMDVIQRQAGSLHKAILEGVMNSIDAGCTRCEVTIGPDQVRIVDDGKGITERAQIEQFFETFGQPHDEAEGKRYGAFRMGRGQMFAFGYNTWRTGPFVMQVDIKNKGLDYELETRAKAQAGCTVAIDLYAQLLPGDLAETVRTIARWVRYAPVPVLVNGKVVSADPAAEKWDHVTDEAYVRLTGNGDLSIYNLGVHTTDLGNYRFGTGGVIVSRKQLRVNFARNDVQADCPVWRKVKPFVDAKARAKLGGKAGLSDHERQRVIDLLVQGDPPAGVEGMKIVTAVNGRHFSLAQLHQESFKYRRRITSCPKGNRVGDKVFVEKVAFVVAAETLEKFGCDLARLVRYVDETVESVSVRLGYRRPVPAEASYEVVPFEDVSVGLEGTFELLAEEDLTATEALWLDIARRTHGALLDRENWDDAAVRRIVAGTSASADGWTDGATYVALDRKFIRTLTLDARGVTELGLLLLHEYCYDEPDTVAHTHGVEFYEKFHHRGWERLPDFVAAALAAVPRALAAAGKDLPREFLKNADQFERTRRALRGLLAEADKLAAPPAE